MSEDKIIKPVSEPVFGPYLARYRVHEGLIKGLKERGMKAIPGSGNKELAGVLDDQRGYSKEDKEWFIKMNSLINLLKKRKSKTIIVGEQVGWSLVSEYKIGNTYIERIGELQKRITKISKDNWLAINGRAIKIDEISLEIPT